MPTYMRTNLYSLMPFATALYIRTYTHTYTCRLCMQVECCLLCTGIHMCICTYTHTYTYVYTYVHTYVHTYICIYVHIFYTCHSHLGFLQPYLVPEEEMSKYRTAYSHTYVHPYNCTHVGPPALAHLLLLLLRGGAAGGKEVLLAQEL